MKKLFLPISVCLLLSSPSMGSPEITDDMKRVVSQALVDDAGLRDAVISSWAEQHPIHIQQMYSFVTLDPLVSTLPKFKSLSDDFKLNKKVLRALTEDTSHRLRNYFSDHNLDFAFFQKFLKKVSKIVGSDEGIFEGIHQKIHGVVQMLPESVSTPLLELFHGTPEEIQEQRILKLEEKEQKKFDRIMETIEAVPMIGSNLKSLADKIEKALNDRFGEQYVDIGKKVGFKIFELLQGVMKKRFPTNPKVEAASYKLETLRQERDL